MACFKPISAWQLESGEVVFVERGKVSRSLFLPCGQCVGCRLERSRQWAVRCVHEAQMHELSCSVTLTYDDDHLPQRYVFARKVNGDPVYSGSLFYDDYQKFFKRVRRAIFPRKVRFFVAGEYGETSARPHYHALLFGIDFMDRVQWKRSDAGSELFVSPSLNRCWGKGNAVIGALNFESAAYAARYVLKKVTGDLADAAYRRVDLSTGEQIQVTPEFCRMSLKPGIGAMWYEKYSKDVFPHDVVVVRGRECKVPRYYDRLLERVSALDRDDVAVKRELKASGSARENWDDRLKVRQEVTEARLRFYKRSL